MIALIHKHVIWLLIFKLLEIKLYKIINYEKLEDISWELNFRNNMNIIAYLLYLD